MRLWIAAFAAAVVMALPAIAGAAQAPELQIRSDKGGYLAGEAATVTVTGLTECANRTIAIGMRGAARGQRFASADATLDGGGNGSVRVPLMTDNGGAPVQPAAWGDCVDRGFEPGLALDPHPTLISISFLTESELTEFLPSGARDIARTVARGDLEGILAALTPGSVIQTAYPGDGGPLPVDTARTQLRDRLTQGSGSDEYGLGRLALLGVWEINGTFAVLASSIRAGGARHVEALGLAERDGRWWISSYGSVVTSTGILEQYALQHRLRLGSIGPLAPAVGDSPPLGESRDSDHGGVVAMASIAVAAVLALLGTCLAVRRTGGLPPPAL